MKKNKNTPKKSKRAKIGIKWRMFAIILAFIFFFTLAMWIFQIQMLNYFYQNVKYKEFDVTVEMLENVKDENLKTITEKEFSAVLRKTMEETQSKHIFEAFIGDMDENDKLNYDSNIRIENDFTVEYLRKLGFEWNVIDFEYIKKYVEYFKTLGFLEV